MSLAIVLWIFLAIHLLLLLICRRVLSLRVAACGIAVLLHLLRQERIDVRLKLHDICAER